MYSVNFMMIMIKTLIFGINGLKYQIFYSTTIFFLSIELIEIYNYYFLLLKREVMSYLRCPYLRRQLSPPTLDSLAPSLIMPI